MPRKLTIIFALVTAVILASISVPSLFWLFKEGPKLPESESPALHYFNDPSTSIENISLKIVYFIPKDKVDQTFQDWSRVAEETVQKMIAFHNIQFRSKSRVVHEIYPTPKVGEESSAFYDEGGTALGNPNAALRIDQELSRKLAPFFKTAPHEFLVKLFVYEGVGASATGNAVILSRDYLSQDSYRDTRASVFYHEFGHTLGMPEGYDIETNIPSTPDIMGSGRFRPIEITYVSEDTKSAMGLR
ncbi:MAG: hypothetical protein HYS57_02630 [Parcubacteria group bacterium]|nr:hypothetical protein [Parcubacteria group bacterium]